MDTSTGVTYSCLSAPVRNLRLEIVQTQTLECAEEYNRYVINLAEHILLLSARMRRYHLGYGWLRRITAKKYRQ